MSRHLDDDELRSAYAPLLEGTAARTADCPSPEALLRAVRGEGPESERMPVLDHALTCPACRPELALLHGIDHAGARAANAGEPRVAWRRWVPVAAAAILVIAVGVVGVDRWAGREGGITRRGDTGGPALVAPADPGEVGPGPVSFVWRAVPRARTYTIEVDAPDGSVVFSGGTADTTLIVQLTASGPNEYRWWVRAHRDDGTVVRSETRVLRAAGGR